MQLDEKRAKAAETAEAAEGARTAKEAQAEANKAGLAQVEAAGEAFQAAIQNKQVHSLFSPLFFLTVMARGLYPAGSGCHSHSTLWANTIVVCMSFDVGSRSKPKLLPLS